jgi:putative LysE/RhtB family amino acid efflux pump
MQLLIPFFKAIGLGFSIAAPVGPIGLLCIRYAITRGFIFGIAVGLGAALADGLYAALMSSGIGLLVFAYKPALIGIKLCGASLLIYLGIKEWKSTQPQKEKFLPSKKSFLMLVLMVFLLTFGSPMTLFSFLGLISGSLSNIVDIQSLLIIILGVFLGSMSWWIFLSFVCAWSKHRISDRMMGFIRKGSALFLIGFGVFCLSSLRTFL